MSLKKFNPRLLVLIAFMVVIAIIRIVFTLKSSATPITNFTPIGAMALFGGAYFNKSWKAYLLPICTLWISDIILNRAVYYHEWRLFYDGFYWTYGTFILIAFAGQRIIKKVSAVNVVLASVVAVLIHWIGTSPGCFTLPNSIYPYTWTGYWESLIGAIPYEKDFLIGTLVYSGIMFGAFEWINRKMLKPAVI
jgi:uncharacterized protein DUF6580